MRLLAILRILGVIVGLTSLTKLPSALVAIALEEATAPAYFNSFVLSGLIGLLLYWPNRRVHYDLRLRDGFLIVTVTWVAACLVSALPLWLGPPNLSFADAVFEATSGLTTTGATVIVGLDKLGVPAVWRHLAWIVPTLGALVWALRRPDPATASEDEQQPWSDYAVRAVMVGIDAPRPAAQRAITGIVFGAPLVVYLTVTVILEALGFF